MRPQELDVTFSIYEILCKATEDAGGDEPYMWILGFKVDADTISSQTGSLIPNLGVRIFEGVPASPFLVGPNDIDASTTPLPIQAALGTRSFRLKPALIPLGGWFAGIAGVICLLWDQDAFAPSTSEAGYKRFAKVFGPALSTELNALVNGTYDDPLSRDANNVVVPMPSSGPTLQWRLDRLGDSAGRKNAVKAITNTVKGKLTGELEDALTDAAGLDELIDPDDLLGVAAEVYMGADLLSRRDFSMDFTEEGADYTARGFAIGSAVHRNRLDTTVIEVKRDLDRTLEVWAQVCRKPPKLYWALAFRTQTKTRFELKTMLGDPPTAVRWFLNETELVGSPGSITVHFESMASYLKPPQDVVAPYYVGGDSPLKFSANGSVLEIWNEGGAGAFFGKVTALWAFAGDPSLTAAPGTSFAQSLTRGYDRSTDFGILAIEVDMNSDYLDDLRECVRSIAGLDVNYLPANWGKVVIEPGEPPPYRQVVLDQMAVNHVFNNLASVTAVSQPILKATTSVPSAVEKKN